MNTVLFTKELKRNRKNTLIWTSIVLAFTLMILSIYPSFSHMGEDMVKLMSSLPEEYAKAFGMDEATWSSIIGFYATYYGIYITLLMGIYTASTGATIIGKEERDGTAEFLLT
ncbi:MAG: multidrug ABC transporter permease, partial [Flavobacteriia bacterium]|nr:multidrug ABC transporter permease [Flavobacteriia bacterium]